MTIRTEPSAPLPQRPDTADPELDRLLHPGRFYDTPDDVLEDPGLSLQERRAILSSWASDACAVESCPGLRAAPLGRRPVPFDDIMDALKRLDAATDAPPSPVKQHRRHGGTPMLD